MKSKNQKGVMLAITAAICYSISSPLSKLMLNYLPSTLMAGFLYLGAGVCMGLLFAIFKIFKISREEKKFEKKDLPYIILMVLLDIAAPILLLLGLKEMNASSVSLLNNFEIVATSLIAFLIFKEKITWKTWVSIGIVTIASFFLCVEDVSSFKFSLASLYVIGATICWGFENNCTRKISDKDPLKTVFIKGLFSGLGSLIIGFSIGERITTAWPVFAVIGIGLVAYGLSIFAYVYAQRYIGAARTSVFYSIAPFIGTGVSLIIFLEKPNWSYFVGLVLMIVGMVFANYDLVKSKIFNKSI